MKFRTKPSVVEAVQFTGDVGAPEIVALDVPCMRRRSGEHVLVLTTIHGEQAIARPGDWVISEPAPGRHYPCAPDIFAARYEPDVQTKPSSALKPKTAAMK